MIPRQSLYAAGIPAVADVIAKAMKAANIAENDGYAKTDILAFVHCLVHNKDLPGNRGFAEKIFRGISMAR